MPAPNPQGIPDTIVAPLMIQIRDCLERELGRSLSGPPLRRYLDHNQALPVMDGCVCQGPGPDGRPRNGDAWVRLISESRATVGSTGLGLGAFSVAECPVGTILTLEIGVQRCVPQTPRGDPPTPQFLDEHAMARASDRAALWRVLSCCPALVDPEGDALWPVLSADYVPLGPIGNCSGGALTFQIENTRNYPC